MINERRSFTQERRMMVDRIQPKSERPELAKVAALVEL
jgi:hypothetical protein